MSEWNWISGALKKIFGLSKKDKHIENWERNQEYNSKVKFIFDYSLIDNVAVEGIDERDAPDFCDAFISSADYDGRPMTDEELDQLNEDSDFVYECVESSLY